mgnify:CR=1 FL=1
MLASEGYVADRSLATLTYLSLTLNRPIFLEGEAGVGKTELAKVNRKSRPRKSSRVPDGHIGRVGLGDSCKVASKAKYVIEKIW